MSKRKNRELNDLIDLVLALAIFGLLSLWLTNRKVYFVVIGIVLLVILAIGYIFIKNKKNRFNKNTQWLSGKSLLNELRKMHPSEFEKYIADLYNRLGYKTEAVGRSHDGGIDVIATKRGIKHYIQCKKYITSKAGVKEVREFYGSMADRLSGARGIFITTNVFTTEAEKYAEDKPIELVDGDRLLKLIKLTRKETEEISAKNEKSCPLCGGKLLEKNGRYGIFWGCENYPACKHTEKKA